MSDEYTARRLRFDLTRGQSRFLDQELNRLKIQFGIELTYPDYLALLIDMQRIRVLAQQGDEPRESIGWMYQKIRGMYDEVLSERGSTPDDPVRDDGMDQTEDRDRALDPGQGV